MSENVHIDIPTNYKPLSLKPKASALMISQQYVHSLYPPPTSTENNEPIG